MKHFQVERQEYLISVLLRLRVKATYRKFLIHSSTSQNVTMKVHGKENTHDYFPKSAAEEYTLNFIKPTWETQTQHQTALFSSMCFIYNSLNAAGNVTFKYLGFCYVLT